MKTLKKTSPIALSADVREARQRGIPVTPGFGKLPRRFLARNGWLAKTPIVIFFYLALLTAGCASTEITVKDLQTLPQDHAYYLTPGLSYLPEPVQKAQERLYISRYFFPWHPDRYPPPQDTFTKPFLQFMENPGYGENGQKRNVSWFEELRKNAALENYPNMAATAISLTTTNLRFVPTDKPRFNTPDGYPFDRFQISSILPNTPLRVIHVSSDRAWFLVEAPYAHGWIASRDMAFVDGAFIRTWESGKYAVIIQDKTPVYDQHANFLFHAPIGSVFPITEETNARFRVLAAVADINKQGAAVPAYLSKRAAAVRPLPLTGRNMIQIANELINEPYGWGGLYQNRDCSAMLKDFFAPFGIWLPRYSGDQAREVGLFTDLSALSRQEKEKKILEEGVPYLTLLLMRGHIMLYMGVHNGKPLVFHNVWRVTVKNKWGSEPQRVNIGYAAITTLYPQTTEDRYGPYGDDLIDKLIGMTLVVHPKDMAP